MRDHPFHSELLRDIYFGETAPDERKAEAEKFRLLRGTGSKPDPMTPTELVSWVGDYLREDDVYSSVRLRTIDLSVDFMHRENGHPTVYRGEIEGIDDINARPLLVIRRPSNTLSTVIILPFGIYEDEDAIERQTFIKKAMESGAVAFTVGRAWISDAGRLIISPVGASMTHIVSPRPSVP